MKGGEPGRRGRGSLWLVLYLVLLLNLSISLLFILAVNTLWSDVNSYVSDALGLTANWVLVVNVATAVLLANAVFQIIRIARRRSLSLNASPRPWQKAIYLPTLLLWNAMIALLLVVAGDGVLRAQLVYHYQLLTPWVDGRQGGATGRSVEPGQFFDEQILFDATADPLYLTFRIPGLVITGQGVIVAYCEARKGFSDWAEIDVVMRRSVDGGETWQQRALLADSDEGTVHNPLMIAEQSSETIHLLYNVDYRKAFYARSEDAGATWSGAVDITPTFQEFRREYHARVFAIGPGHGIQLRSGRLLAPVWLSPGRGSDGHHPAVVATIYSDDGGRSWERGEIVGDLDGPTADETTAVELSDGSVMLNMRNEDYSLARVYRAVSISPDGATGWSVPRLDEQLPDALCFGSLHRYDEGTILFSNIHLELKTGFALRRLNLWGAREPLGIRVSYDDGKSWPVSKIYQHDEAGYSDINVRGGTIFSLYEQGWEKKNKYRTRYLKLVRFDLDWVTAP
jgi:sialidase-1